MKQKLSIIKVGGKIVEENTSLKALLQTFAALPGKKILVHGGGRSATKMASSMGLESKMVNGRRITDEAMLRIVTMVYGGLVNKTIVAGLQALGTNALGLTGADINAIRSVKRPVEEVDYGFVGDVVQVNGTGLRDLLDLDIVPVMAPLTHDAKGTILNTNADTIAGETAKELANYYEVTLVYCFEKNGVLLDENEEDSVIKVLRPDLYAELKEKKVICGGMIPKLDNAFAAVQAGVKEVLITKASNLGSTNGTRITL
ncbi:MAG: acetylglutamate kinase [Massilibacteroides sp.]|nr:acetylglutamate kinase [Massilibacteroides sp.]